MDNLPGGSNSSSVAVNKLFESTDPCTNAEDSSSTCSRWWTAVELECDDLWEGKFRERAMSQQNQQEMAKMTGGSPPKCQFSLRENEPSELVFVVDRRSSEAVLSYVETSPRGEENMDEECEKMGAEATPLTDCSWNSLCSRFVEPSPTGSPIAPDRVIALKAMHQPVMQPWEQAKFQAPPEQAKDTWLVVQFGGQNWMVRQHGGLRKNLYLPLHKNGPLASDLTPERVTVRFEGDRRTVETGSWMDEVVRGTRLWRGYTFFRLRDNQPVVETHGGNPPGSDVEVEVGRHYHQEQNMSAHREAGPRPSPADGSLGTPYRKGCRSEPSSAVTSSMSRTSGTSSLSGHASTPPSIPTVSSSSAGFQMPVAWRYGREDSIRARGLAAAPRVKAIQSTPHEDAWDLISEEGEEVVEV